MTSTRSTAFVINGGAGRVLCSIPAFEKFHEENPDDDFIIVCEGGTEFYKGHPILDDRAYDHWNKNLFKDKIKDKSVVVTEPYHVWEYYNQQCSLAQAFDIQINNKGIRDLPSPRIELSSDEKAFGENLIREVKERLNVEKVVVFQPFGRGIQDINGTLVDPSGRSFHLDNVISLIKKFHANNWGVILFSEIMLDAKQAGIKKEVAHPENTNLRVWTSIVETADLFVGCDSVGQHLSHAKNTPTIAVLGATFPINVSYQETETFKVMDLGEDERRYSPIRIVVDESVDRHNEKLMWMTSEIEDYIIETAQKII